MGESVFLIQTIDSQKCHVKPNILIISFFVSIYSVGKNIFPHTICICHIPFFLEIQYRILPYRFWFIPLNSFFKIYSFLWYATSIKVKFVKCPELCISFNESFVFFKQSLDSCWNFLIVLHFSTELLQLQISVLLYIQKSWFT